MTTCPNCGHAVPEAKAEPGEHVDYQPPSEPGSQTAVPPGLARVRVDGTTETEIAIPDEVWKREGGLDEAAFKDLGIEPLGEDDPDFDPDLAVDDSDEGLSMFASAEPEPEVEAKVAAPAIERGAYVTSPGGSGRVDLVVLEGKVTGTDSGLVATREQPAVRLVLADGSKVAVMAALCAVTDPPAPRVEHKGLAALVALVEDEAAQVGLSAARVEVAYRRGLKGWPGPSVTRVEREDWALGRARALVEAKDGRVIEGFADTDLLA